MSDDGAGRPEYYTTTQLAHIILYLQDKLPVDIDLSEDAWDAIAWAAELIRKDTQ